MYVIITKGDPEDIGARELVATCTLADDLVVCTAASPAHTAFVEKLRTQGVWSGSAEQSRFPQDGRAFLNALGEAFDHPALLASTPQEGTPPSLS